LGSGLIGLLARHILGDSYKFIPFKKSRYYSHKVPIADNEIVVSEGMHDVLKSLNLPTTKEFFPTAISIGGQLMFNRWAWAGHITQRMYEDKHPFATKLLSQDVDAFRISAQKLYEILLSEYIDEVKKHEKTEVIRISDHTIETSEGAIKYDKMVSTIPLNALLKMVGMGHFLEAKDYHVFLVATDMFNLEGARRCFIGDRSIPFWKANVINRELFQFFSNGIVEGADVVFSLLTKKRFQIIADTVIKNAFPMGAPPTGIYEELKKLDITCAGSNARWDYFSDISTSVNSILKME
jgi:hypothetical protein